METDLKPRYGPYVTPVFAVGAVVECEIRGLVRIVRLSNANIPWPIGEQDGQQALVVYKALSRALRQEAPHVIAACFGVPLSTAQEWQRLCTAPRSRKKQTKKRLPLAWKREEDELLTRLSLSEVARLTGRTLTAVRKRRRLLGLPDGRLATSRAERVLPLDVQVAQVRQRFRQRYVQLRESLATLESTYGRARTTVGYWRARAGQRSP